ncbi:MAG: DUF1326 domain-containing protein [Chloroflexi bacterium]|nr:DUF1326 domain-containing protein [Chloroflexota bacterium]
MAWNSTGNYWSPCSCRVGCPCTLGEEHADQGWCAGTLVFEIRSGRVDDTDVSGAKIAFAVDFPGGMLQGKGTGRLYFDPAVPQAKRAALEAVLGGKKGGVFEPLSALFTKVLPSKEASINIQKGKEETRITVGSFGELVVKPLKAPSGQLTRLLHGAFAFRDDITLAKGTGSRWSDPDMRRWESGGHAEQADFDWSA